MATIQLLIGGATLFPSTSKELRKKQAIAGASVKDKSVTIDRVLAARMRNATVDEIKRLSNISMQEFRVMMLGQGINVARYTDGQLREAINNEIFHLRKIAIHLLQADFLKSDTPMIIAGTPKGALGLVAKILGPTTVASGMPIDITVWWTLGLEVRIEALHYSDKNNHRVINP
ncbi:MAG: hypothetical protein CML20_16395 [Rheinheimera sp.]|uniref:hypothetical protein n=1 Tax=Arsukibacterium sp. UBA3155 TaxID=1946058 RepID=UPI000C931A3E|nr:hypothetical protein [Arsukibacterium sp. UBA3155]MAD76340.1 hypothetical protein [Rheinheimera sp.]|tara:strand:+ start:102654 stop:103175 length:522 start_codon:yes stop_codon:yes gene_type:complete